MPIPATQFIWFNGKLVPWEKATVHVLSHALHYASSVFEGVRAYETRDGVAIFRLRDHTRRLFDSAKIYRIAMPFSPEQINEACRQVIVGKRAEARRVPAPGRVQGLRRDRRVAQERSADGSGDCRVGMGQVSRQRERGSRRRRVRLLVESRGAEHHSGAGQGGRQLPLEPAHRRGGAPPRLRRRHRACAGWHGERRRGREPLPRSRTACCSRPALAHSALSGITRDCVMRLARDRGLEVRECAIPREMLYLADELFMTGTAAEITPIRSVDRLPVGQRQARADHGVAAERLLRALHRQDAGQVGLARPGGHVACRAWLRSIDA